MLQRTSLAVLLALAAAQAQTPTADTSATAPAPAVQTPVPVKPDSATAQAQTPTVQAPAPVKPAPAVASLEKPNAFHMHPIFTGVTLAVSGIPTWWYLTYERELGNGKSITIQPVFTTGQFEPDMIGLNDDENPVEVSWFGVTGAFRIYTNGSESRGHYFAPAFMYSKATGSQEGRVHTLGTSSYKEDDDEITVTTVGLLVYTGYRGKNGAFSWYIDAGLGYKNVSFDTSDDTDLDEVEDKLGSSLAYDVNYGIGIAF